MPPPETHPAQAVTRSGISAVYGAGAAVYIGLRDGTTMRLGAASNASADGNDGNVNPDVEIGVQKTWRQVR